MTRKYALLLITLVLVVGLSACGGVEQPALSATPEPSPVATPAVSATPVPDKTPAPPPSAEGTVTQAVAHYFPDIQGSANLYAAVEFKNESTSNAVVSSVTLHFTVDGKAITQTFTPPLAQLDVISPGGISTAAGWFTHTSVPKEAVSVTAEVILTPVDQPQQRPMEVSNLLIVQNYPNFATVSGRAANTSAETDYDLTMIYLSIYDDQGRLLGVQFFTKDLTINAGDARDFVYHLRGLPIERLTENAATITARGMGIN